MGADYLFSFNIVDRFPIVLLPISGGLQDLSILVGYPDSPRGGNILSPMTFFYGVKA